MNLLLPVLPNGNRRKKLIVAVSGGADSVALLHLLVDAGYGNLVVAHFNHHLRGKASDRDSSFVASLAAKLDLPCERGSGDVRKLASEGKCSLETAAREARYSFLAAVARKHRVRTVLLAHHADDQVETCLFNFLRGSGIAGISGMKPEAHRTVEGIRLTLLRPLLGITKEQLLQYLASQNLPHREDSTNAQPVASRNRIRHQILPLIAEALTPSFRESILRNARLLADEEEFLAGLAAPLAANVKLPLKPLREFHPALRRRVLHAWLKNRGVIEPGFAEVERVGSLLDPDGPAKVNLPGNLHARRRAGVLFIE